MGNYENFDEQKQFACRVIADHARTTAFAIADGILPGNEGRNYVLRKIMRRAIYHGREHLGFDGLFFNKVCDFVVGEMNGAFPELEVQREFIGKMVRLEEERFGNTLTVGLRRLEEFNDQYFLTLNELSYGRMSERFRNKGVNDLAKVTASIQRLKNRFYENAKWKKLSCHKELESILKSENHFPDAVEFITQLDEQIFDLENTNKHVGNLAQIYDTYGVPKDLILLSLREHGFDFDDARFDRIFDEALIELQSKGNIGKTNQSDKINPIYVALERTSVKSIFHGYDATSFENSKVIALVKNDERVDQLMSGEEGLIILDETPFYAESGGQVGDSGTLVRTGSDSDRVNADRVAIAPGSDKTADNAFVKVFDTFAPVQGIILHKSKIESGSIKVGDTVTAKVDVEKRDATRRNHTATHLVHAALKEVLGTHVKQGGSVVAPTYLRFDYTHYQPLTTEEIKEVEDLVNRYILQNEPVNTNVMAIEEAMRSGAVALFGEKYGSDVRVLSVGNGEFSKELCGGTHVRATGDIGSFKITSDESVASGLRRIRAITGFDAFERFREDELLIDRSLGFLKTQRDQLPFAIEKLQEELKKTRKENDDLKMKIATGAISSVSSNGDEGREISGVKVIAKIVDGLDKSGMRHLSDTILAKMKSGVVVLARTEEDKVSFIVRVSDDLTDRVKAGKIVQEIAPIVGGRGGGKPDMAEGGGTDSSKLNDALEASYKSVETMLGG